MDVIQLQKLVMMSQDLFITRLIHRPVVDSTNNLAIELANEGDADGLVVIADCQTAGKGRRGNDWFSPEGNLYMSVVLASGLNEEMPSSQNNLFQLITFMSAISVVDAIKDLLDKKISLKWPNDIHIEDKKVGGILIESRYEGEMLKFIVIGIGINLINTSLPPSIESKATYINQFLNRPISRDDIVFSILKSLDTWLKRFRQKRFDEIVQKWKAYNNTIGRLVRVTSDERIITGLAKDISNVGSLIIQDNKGQVFSITNGSLEFL
ncbi:MAG: biotin--[acetyl-CoA-carboxylase] ligase [Thermodesulfovibrionales bacterium]|nr:biotin--[acetyl-CoA-carboxylase] ligase [Thermodesulfovibrionales bacterium]